MLSRHEEYFAMSVLDKIAAAVTPPESDADRANARQIARNAAQPGDWLSTVLDHHALIGDLLDQARDAQGAEARRKVARALATFVTGHAQAEETVLYPAIEQHGEKGAATMAYSEQAMTKVEFARLEALDPATKDWEDKLAHIRGALLHHIYEEEGTWLPRLKQSALEADQALLNRRFVEEFERYMGTDAARPEGSAFPQMGGGGAKASVPFGQ
jgi:hemerythrin superfamily protein